MRTTPAACVLLLVQVLVPGPLADEPGAGQARELSFESRVELQRELDRLSWSQRIWPSGASRAQRSFDRAVPDETIRTRAAEGPRKSLALEIWFDERVEAADLEAEIRRIARDTRDPKRLAQMWRILHDDPMLVAEMIARPIVADRKLRARYSDDTQYFDVWWVKVRDGIRPEIPVPPPPESLPRLSEASCIPDTWMPMNPDTPEPRYEHSAVWTGSEMIVFGGKDAAFEWLNGHRYDPVTDSWSPVATDGAPYGADIALWTGDRMIVWNRRGPRGDRPGCGLYDPVTDVWEPMSETGSPYSRYYYAWGHVGDYLVIWGGVEGGTNLDLDTGARYDITNDTWTPTTLTDVPEARVQSTSCAAGGKLFVWGGVGTAEDYVQTGAMYDPVADTWTAVTPSGAPSGRGQASAVWSGSEVIVWGGWDDSRHLSTGGRYDPSTDTWTTTSHGGGAPGGRAEHTAVWSGARMLVFGGIDGDGNAFGDGAAYDPVGNDWTGLETDGSPTPRRQHTAVWTGTEMLIWGGRDSNDEGWTNALASGGRYDPSTDSWSATYTSSTRPSARAGNAAVWTGAELLVWGGLIGNTRFDDGSRYDPVTDTWTTISSSGSPSARSRPVYTWTGDRLLIWGGENGDSSGNITLLDGGALYDPATDTWSSISDVGQPAPRIFPQWAWTGAELFVYGGRNLSGGLVSGGARYVVAADQWTPISTIGAIQRSRGFGMWTGSKVLLAGGSVPFGADNRIAQLYDPLTDTWSDTSDSGEDLGPGDHGLWAGDEALFHGDVDLRYDPRTDTWTDIPSSPRCSETERPSGSATCSQSTARRG